MTNQQDDFITFTSESKITYQKLNENGEPTEDLITLSVVLAEIMIDGERLFWTVTYDKDLAIDYPEIVDSAVERLRNRILESLPDRYHLDVIHASEAAKNRIVESI